ncbi:MAG: recombination protein RecR [Legionellales bacterium RIFCSPHIGHO2_12_FULL_35_11]|nr:MAG: recombination protein RecR [Legionellales bacterium RIFCSPHIGHO2_12_FULL_35_11]
MDSISSLVEALRCLPGIGPKSAQRMVFHLLKHGRERGINLASCLQDAMLNIIHCDGCNNYTSKPICNICSNANRDKTKICIVEGPTDLIAIEQTTAFNGIYFVLMGKISPLDGIGPEDIGLNNLQKKILEHQIDEVIIALSSNIEGQTTVHYIQEMLRSYSVEISQLAQGIPSGGDLNFLDSSTINSAFRNRAILHLSPE